MVRETFRKSEGQKLRNNEEYPKKRLSVEHLEVGQTDVTTYVYTHAAKTY